MIPTTLQQAPRFLLSGSATCEIHGDVATFIIERLDNLSESALTPLVQLWACENAPTAEGGLGFLVAQFAAGELPPGGSLTEVKAEATLAESVRGVYQLVLAVAEVSTPTVWEDQRLLDPAHQFLQPSLLDPVQFLVSQRGIEVALGGYENPRGRSNLSGSLTLELWALPEPYRGGPVTGQCIGQLLQGTLVGGEKRTDLHLRFLPWEHAESTHLCLLLREWNGTSYLTRDFRNAPAGATESPQEAAPTNALAPNPLEEAEVVQAASAGTILAGDDGLTTAEAGAAALAVHAEPQAAEATPPEAPEAPSAEMLPREATQPVIDAAAAHSIVAEEASLAREVAAAPETPQEQDNRSAKIPFWRRIFRQSPK